MLLRITEGADGKEFKYLTPFDAPGSEASKYLHRFEPKKELCQNANKGIFNLTHGSNLLIVDSPPFSLSDPTGCLRLLLWSVLDSQKDKATLLIYTNHSKNNQKAVEKYQGGANGEAQLSYLLFQPCKHTRSQ